MHAARRRFLLQSAGLLGGAWFANGARAAQPRRERLPVAAVVTEYRQNSHADVIVGKILEGYDQAGGPGPDLRLVSLYTDQVPKNDMSRDLAKKHGFRIAKSIEEALTLGGDKLAVAGVLSIGEHGNYPYTKDTNQHMYPRRRFFDAIVAVLRKHRRAVPLFSDKHLAYAWADAKHMVDTARELRIPFIAGSSLPVAWRQPALTLPRGCALTEALVLGYGGLESYGFHALEALQCMVERRRGGETGVVSVQAVRGDEIGRAEKAGRWSRELLDAAVATTPAPRKGRPKEFAKNAVFYLIEYRDGLRACVAMRTGLAAEFAFAGKIRGEARPQATWFRLQEGAPFRHFEHQLRAIDHTFHTGRPAYPVERTLLTTGVLDTVMHSLAEKDRLIRTPNLDVSYQPTDWGFAQGMPP
ncbi:MAG: hypothetical protein L0Y71_12645 [Gemmataceae bacterium]|nr:hypothetical protein [Gemmataceae bacterium]